MKRIQNILLLTIVLLMMVGCASKRTATVTNIIIKQVAS